MLRVFLFIVVSFLYLEREETGGLSAGHTARGRTTGGEVTRSATGRGGAAEHYHVWAGHGEVMGGREEEGQNLVRVSASGACSFGCGQ